MPTKTPSLEHLRIKKGKLLSEQFNLRLATTSELSSLNKRKLDKINFELLAVDESIRNLLDGLYKEVEKDPLMTLEESVPILLFPLRIETRFAEGGDQLWIRIFPDEVAIHTHEDLLTESELKGGMFYWKELWKNQKNSKFQELKKKTWKQIANHFGPNRASWIVRQTRPEALGVDAQGEDDFSNIIDTQGLDPVLSVKSTKTQAWSENATCRVMPDLLRLRLYNYNPDGTLLLLYEELGKPIPNPLPMGPDPLAYASQNPELDWTGSNIEWMQNFDTAVSIGMGFKVTIKDIQNHHPRYNKDDGFRMVMVYGVRAAGPKPDLIGHEAINTLFKNHLYSNKGLALVRQGTPTNNTEKERSGFQEQGMVSDERYEQENRPLFAGTSLIEKTDGQLLAEALSLKPELLRTVEQSQNKDYHEAVCMNQALYPATLGFYLENLLNHPLHHLNPRKPPAPLFSAHDLRELRSFFCQYVTGRGPLPVFRVGAQPYGVLPTSNFLEWKWKPPSKQKSSLYGNLRKILYEIQQQYSKATVDHVGENGDPTSILHRILELHPNSMSFFKRIGFSKNSIEQMGHNLNPFLINLLGYNPIAPEGVLQLGKLVFSNRNTQIKDIMLVDRVPVSETNRISVPESTEIPERITHEQNYIRWLFDTYIRDSKGPGDINGIKKGYFFDKTGEKELESPLLYKLLKHAMLLELYKCVYYWFEHKKRLPLGFSLFSSGTGDLRFIAGKEYFNKPPIKDITPMELLETIPSGKEGDIYAAQHILLKIKKLLNSFPRNSIAGQTYSRLVEFFDALREIEILPSARLERCLIEHLDCLTYRLDAWQTGLFFQKLEVNRKKVGEKSLYIGAFGWLENLKPKAVKIIEPCSPEEAVPTISPDNCYPERLKPKNGNPVLLGDNLGGFIQAPSTTHAKTAALLRNAYLHHFDDKNFDLIAVNLTSDRVRKALQIFDGIQKNQPIGALLGYRFERGLHDQSPPLDKYIPDFRKAFPLTAKTIPTPGTSDSPQVSESERPREWFTVVDGLAITNMLKNAYASNKLNYPFGYDLPVINNSDEKDKITKIMEDLLDCVDAMQDLIVTESIYQLSQGNADRAGALLKSIGEFKPPPVFEAVRTPRSSAQTVTQRCCILLNGRINPIPRPWSAGSYGEIPISPRAIAEPTLNEWLGNVVGQPDRIECLVTHVNEDKSEDNQVVHLSDLKLQPIDVVYCVGKNLDSDESEFAQRIAYFYRTSKNIPDEIPVNIYYEVAAEGKISFKTIFPLLWRLKELITQAKPLNAQDFDLQTYPNKDNPENLNVSIRGPENTILDIGNIIKRLDKAKKALKLVGDQLKFANRRNNAEGMRTALIKAASFGIPSALPKSATGSDKEKLKLLKEQTELISKRIDEAMGESDLLKKKVDQTGLSFSQRVTNLISSFKALFGGSFNLLPRFHFTEGKALNGEVGRSTEIDSAYQHYANGGNDLLHFIAEKTNISSRPRLLQGWIDSVARVRPRMRNFETIRMLHNAFFESSLDLNIMQLPYTRNDQDQDQDQWLGMEFPGNLPDKTHKLSIVMHHQMDGFQAQTGLFCGLLLDDWFEEIPGKEETTGITFQYDQPNTQAPQTLLLAISPNDGGKWDWDKLENILHDTLNRAKRRGVTIQDIKESDWFSLLPAVLSEFSHKNANISLIFR